jgi:hypothetical protein
VYLGAVVIMASVLAQALPRPRRRSGGRRAFRRGQASRRWLSWWRGAFLLTDVFVNLRARLIGVVVGCPRRLF